MKITEDCWVRDPKDGDIWFNIYEPEEGSYLADCCEVWVPKEGEFCWDKQLGLVQIINVQDGLFTINSVFSCVIEVLPYTSLQFEPFIGKLPTWVRSK